MFLQSLTHPVGSSYVNRFIAKVENIYAAIRNLRQLTAWISA